MSRFEFTIIFIRIPHRIVGKSIAGIDLNQIMNEKHLNDFEHIHIRVGMTL
ncbi:hypothetical protein D3C74_425360 [compost metagenome]